MVRQFINSEIMKKIGAELTSQKLDKDKSVQKQLKRLLDIEAGIPASIKRIKLRSPITIKEGAVKPLRERVEVYARSKDGRILAGTYPDGSVGVFGGGTDGEKIESAAKKEYREEAGRRIANVERIQGVKPFTKKWKDDPSVNKSPSPKQKARMEQYSGSKTIFVTGDLAGKAKMVDGHKLKNVKLKTVEELIEQQKKAIERSDGQQMKDVQKARLEVLTRLRDKTASVLRSRFNRG